jgi:hypothetical protein
MAGHVRLELRNVVAKYPFERSHRFPVIQPNSGRRDYSRSSCDGGRRSSGPVPGSRQDACAGRNCRDFLPIPFGLPAFVALPPCGQKKSPGAVPIEKARRVRVHRKTDRRFDWPDVLRLPSSHLGCGRPDCVAGHVRFELRNVVANYPFESSRGFPGSEPNSGQGDHSRLSCGAGIRSSGLGSAGIFSKRSARTLAIMRRRREGTNWPRSLSIRR